MQVIELLEDQAKKEIEKPLLEGDTSHQTQRKTFRNFVLHPCLVGKELFPIIKFGLVQYVKTIAFT